MDHKTKKILPVFMFSNFYTSLLILEQKFPSRALNEKVLSHEARNFFIAALSGLSLSLTEKPLMKLLTTQVKKKKFGLLPLLRVPAKFHALFGIIFLDYTLYLWHRLNHKSKFLWRFHVVHHQDLDLSASTGIRFHFFEMLLSVVWRALQVLLIGVTAPTLRLWQNFTLIEILFHHSNVRLPRRVEALLNILLVTPRMHAIHHSIKPEETNSNWSSGLTIWDILHRTYKKNFDQEKITIGAPSEIQKKLNLWTFLKKPFLSR